MNNKKDIRSRLKELEEEMTALRTELRSDRQMSLDRFSESLEVLVSRVSDVSVAIPVALVLEVLPRVYLNPIPESPQYLAGYLQWRGVPVPVMDPAVRWGDAPLPVRLEDRIIVLSLPEGPRGLLVSEVEQLAVIKKEDLGKIPAEIPASAYAVALWYSAQKNILLLAPESLFDPIEMAKYALT